MKQFRIISMLFILLGLYGCGSGEDGRMVGELAWDRVELTNESAEPTLQRFAVPAAIESTAF